MKRMMALAMVAVSAPALVAGAQAAPVNRLFTGAAATPMYMNVAAPIDRRVNDLLSRMTLQEKIGQMDQIVVGRLRAAEQPRRRRLQRRQHDAAAAELPAARAGHLQRRARSCPAAPTTRPTTRGTAGRTCTTPSSATRSSIRGCTSRSSTASTPCTASATRPTRP